MDSSVLWMVMMVVLFIGTFVYLLIKKTANEVQAVSGKRALERTASYFRLDKSKGILYLYERNPLLSDVIQIRDYKLYVDGYKPKELVYTGVTFAGVTTGTIREKGGNKYNIGSLNTGKFFMTVLDEGGFIRVQLTDPLFQQAQQSNISQYLNAKTKQIEITGTYSHSAGTLAAAKAGNADAFEWSNTKDAADAMPTYEKCTAIKNWICGY